MSDIPHFISLPATRTHRLAWLLGGCGRGIACGEMKGRG